MPEAAVRWPTCPQEHARARRPAARGAVVRTTTPTTLINEREL
ncbi:hypothetical protein [Streptomyces sp. NPDC048272]